MTSMASKMLWGHQLKLQHQNTPKQINFNVVLVAPQLVFSLGCAGVADGRCLRHLRHFQFQRQAASSFPVKQVIGIYVEYLLGACVGARCGKSGPKNSAHYNAISVMMSLWENSTFGYLSDKLLGPLITLFDDLSSLWKSETQVF